MMRQKDTIEAGGSITVFLSLILLLILSLLLTIIEGARINTANVFADRALTTAMDSVLADYYGPLWEEYHLFGLDTGSTTNADWEEEISSQLEDYMSYTFHSDRDKAESEPDSVDLYQISVNSLSVSKDSLLMDYQGKLFVNQAVEYMKYEELGDVLELLFEKMSLLESPKKVSALYEEKQRVEEELVEIDEGILELMELLDGVNTGKKGIEIAKDGSLKTADYFVKKIFFGTVTKEGVGINQESIFLALKDSYINPLLDLTQMQQNCYRLELVIKKIKENELDSNLTSASITTANDTLATLNSIKKKSKEVKAQIKEVKATIKELQAEEDGLQEEKEFYESEKQSYIDSIYFLKENLTLLINQINPCINSSVEVVNHILDKTDRAGEVIKGYEDSLYQAKEELGETIFEGMEEDLAELKSYTQEGDQGYDFAGMKETLEKDSIILTRVLKSTELGAQQMVSENYQNAGYYFQEAEAILQTYRTDTLQIDYSTLVLNKENDFNPIGKAGSFLEDGILGLVVDTNAVSDAELTEDMLPSVIAAMAEDEDGFLDKLATFFEDCVIGDKNSGMGDIFADFGKDAGSLTEIGEGINMIAEHFLFQEYLGEHFNSFPREGEDLNTRKPSVLSYEQEYLLIGKTTDQGNLSSVISRILFLRTILDFVSILGDRDKCNEAALAAAAVVGFTGLPILVSITKTIILLVWAFAEALVDISAMLMGKEIPILKKNLIMTFADLFLLSGTHIQKKASEITKTKELSFTYHDYLRVFLFIKNKKDLSYRSMDLIQENIRIRYFDDFAIQNCLFGFQAEADFTVPSKFTGFRFVQKQLGSSPKGYRFKVKSAYSY
jgi:hypothetical protein